MRGWRLAAVCALLFTVSCQGEGTSKEAVETAVPSSGTDQTSGEKESPGTYFDLNPEPKEDEDEEQTDGYEYQKYMDQLDWSRGPCYLWDVLNALGGMGKERVGYYNISEERLDVKCEDGMRLVFLDGKGESKSFGGSYELMMVDDEFNEDGFRRDYLKLNDSDSADDYFPMTTEWVMEVGDWAGMNQTDLSIARSEIYARHGRRFEDPFLNAVFARKSWYDPRYDSAEFEALKESLLTDCEKENLDNIIRAGELYGYREREGEEYRRLRGICDRSYLDLDGDGVKEWVSIDSDEYAGPNVIESYMLMVNRGVIVRDEEDEKGDIVYRRLVGLHPILYAASLDGKMTQLFICRTEPYEGLEPMADVYIYTDGKLNYAGAVMGGRIEIMDDCFYAYRWMDHFRSFMGKVKYVFEGGMVKEVPSDFYEQNIRALAAMPVTLYKEKGGGEAGPSLEVYDEVVVLGGDNKEWVCIRKEDTGETGWLRCVGFDCILPDGSTVDSYDLFWDVEFCSYFSNASGVFVLI